MRQRLSINNDLLSLLNKEIRKESLTEEETIRLQQWLEQSVANRNLKDKISNEAFLIDDLRRRLSLDEHKAWNMIVPRLANINAASTHRIHFLKTTWFRYAAAIIIMLGVGSYLWFINTTSHPVNQKNPLNPSSDIVSGSNRAILTLADGSTILLDSAANGNLAQQGNATINKLSNGQIVYNLKGLNDGKMMMNTMSTPKGGQYQLTLPDGTKVWLNAASSITYPAAFVDKSRSVKVTGEVYFEVAKNILKPFMVDVDGKSMVEVLATQFNINSYKDEEVIKTTLVEGSIRVSDKGGMNADRPITGSSRILEPGQQAVINPASQNPANLKIPGIVIQAANIEQVLAWKNGLFDLEGMNLQEVARQLERWYNIEVKYEGNLYKKKFGGKLGKDVRLSSVLSWFSKLGIHNRMEGRTLILSVD